MTDPKSKREMAHAWLRRRRETKAAAAGRIAHVAHGAAGLAKATLRIDRADDATIDARRAVCNGCDQAIGGIGGIVTKCKPCGCVLAAKQRLASERCPLGKWDAIAIAIDRPAGADAKT